MTSQRRGTRAHRSNSRHAHAAEEEVRLQTSLRSPRCSPSHGPTSSAGATTTDQLRRNLAAIDLDYAEELDHRLMPLSEKRAENWSTRNALAWD
jgi:hypothetical protein